MALLANIILIVALIALAVGMKLWWRSGNTQTLATNSLLKHRLNRVKVTTHNTMPDACSAHQHEKKLEILEKPVMPLSFFEFNLIIDIDSKHTYLNMNNAQNMRKPHPLLSKLLGNFIDGKALHETVKTDPELVAKILNVANSPLFALTKPITNLHHAIAYLGIVQVKNIATHFALQQSLEFSSTEQKIAYQKIWAASFLSSSIMLVIATAMQLENTAELSTRCQLAYLGDISLLFCEPEIVSLYANGQSYFDRIERIQQLTNTNAAIVGGILAKKWNLPAQIFNALHHGALPFTNQVSGTSLKDTEIQQILTCYCCCRIAESIIFDGSNHILEANSLSFEDTAKEEFYYIPELLEKYKLTTLADVFASPSIKSKMLEMANLTKEKLH